MTVFATDLVRCNLTADRPNELWIAHLTYVSTWRGFAYIAFIIDVFARMIVGWWLSNSLKTDLPFTALEQAIFARKGTGPLVHHSDRGSQYLSRYTERLADAGIAPSVGSVGDSYDNAMAESVIGLYKTEVINKQGPWKHRQAVEFWVDWLQQPVLVGANRKYPTCRDGIYVLSG